MCKSPFFIKVAGGACNFIKKERDSDRWISQNFKVTFLRNTLGDCFSKGKIDWILELLNTLILLCKIV